MRYRPLGKSGLEVSVIGFGAWAIGGGMWGGRRDEDARRALRRAVDHGVNFIDTALVYGNGHSERLISELLKDRRDVAVASKVPPKNMQWPARPGTPIDDAFPKGWITDCCERSLRNLRTERVDLLQLHVWSAPWADQGTWREELEALKRAGKIRCSGVSLNSHDAASGLALVRGGLVDALQVFFNILDQDPLNELFPACAERGVGVLARVPLDEGALTGKLRKDTVFPEGDFRRDYFAGDRLARTVDAVERMRPIVERAAGSMVKGALRFCLSHPAVSTVIPGMRSDAQVDENCAAGDEGPLPPETLAALRPFSAPRAPY